MLLEPASLHGTRPHLLGTGPLIGRILPDLKGLIMQNLETARTVEGVVREQGATPATIAILGGAPHIGLTDEELELLASR